MGSNSKTMQCKVCPLLVLLLATSLSGLNVPGYPYLTPRSPTSYLIPSNFLSSSLPAALPYSIPANRAVICSACSCDSDFFCGCCSCLTSLGCAKNYQSCKGPAQDPQGSSSPSCVASSGPAAGKPCIFPFIYNGVQYKGCTQLINGLASVYSKPTFWCSTKVDVNGYHVRGPWNDKGKNVGFCDDSCPKVVPRFFF